MVAPTGGGLGFGKSILLNSGASMILVSDNSDQTGVYPGSVTPFHRDDNGTPSNLFDDQWNAGARIYNTTAAHQTTQQG